MFYGCLGLFLSSCSSLSGSDDNQQAKAPLKPISCIAVLPAGTSVDKDETVEYSEAQSLEKGAAYATEVLRNELHGNPKVRIMSSGQLTSLVPEISGGKIGTVTEVARKMDCDAVLQTTVRQYRQREGTEYAVDAPASVNFTMVLRDATNGDVLWTTEFREQQQSFLSNIFSFTKAKKRGFKWVSVEKLMEQGIKDRLAQCPYLQ